MRAASASARGSRAAELQRDRMLGGIEAEQPRAVAAQHRAGGDHLGVEPRAARQQAMEEPAMPVGPFHHRRDREAMVGHCVRDLAWKRTALNPRNSPAGLSGDGTRLH